MILFWSSNRSYCNNNWLTWLKSEAQLQHDIYLRLFEGVENNVRDKWVIFRVGGGREEFYLHHEQACACPYPRVIYRSTNCTCWSVERRRKGDWRDLKIHAISNIISNTVINNTDNFNFNYTIRLTRVT